MAGTRPWTRRNGRRASYWPLARPRSAESPASSWAHADPRFFATARCRCSCWPADPCRAPRGSGSPLLARTAVFSVTIDCIRMRPMGVNAMTLITENGWTQCSAQDTDRGPIPGTGIRLPVRQGDAAVILKAWAAWYNSNVEPLRSGVCGCWTPTNDVWNSNHLSGTALDLNWDSYPFRVLTMPPDRVAKV